MNDKIDFSEWEQCNDGMDLEDRKLDFYEQLKTWVQKNAEVRRLRAEVDSEIRLLRNYASMSGIDMTSFIFPEGKFVEKERRCPITRELLFKHCDGLVSEEILQQLCDRINAREVKKYQIFQLDIYLSKKTFIGAMFDSCGISGIISIKKRGRVIPIKFRRVAYVIEDIYHGRKTHWLHEWLNHELTDGMENSEEYELDEEIINRLHQACIEVLAHRNEPDFREICKEKLHCELKPDLSDEALNDFLDEVEELAKATDPREKTDDAVFIVSASW